MTGSDISAVVSNDIESVAFDKTSEGHAQPVLLFRGGFACWDRTLAARMPLDAAAHQKQSPELWRTWRRGTDGIEVGERMGWRVLPYQVEFGRLERDYVLSNVFETSAVLFLGGDSFFLETWRYRFNTDETFEYCYTHTISGAGLIRTERERSAGRYQIDGYTVQLEESSGPSTFQALFYSNQYPNEVWIDDKYFRIAADPQQPVCD